MARTKTPATQRRRNSIRQVGLTIDTPLTEREKLFVAEYTVDFNGAQAMARAGYKGTVKSLTVMGSRLLARVNVAAALREELTNRQARTNVTADRCLLEMARLAYSDIRRYFDEKGELRDIKDLDDHMAAAVASIEVVMKNTVSGDGVIERVYKIKLWDKPKALEMIGKHLGLGQGDGGGYQGPPVPVFELPAGAYIDVEPTIEKPEAP